MPSFLSATDMSILLTGCERALSLTLLRATVVVANSSEAMGGTNFDMASIMSTEEDVSLLLTGPSSRMGGGVCVSLEFNACEALALTNSDTGDFNGTGGVRKKSLLAPM